MNNRKIKMARKILAKEIRNVEDYSVKIKELEKFYNADFVENLIFEIDKLGGKTFSKEIKKVISKIDFTGIDFENFSCNYYDFTNTRGIEIDPQKVHDKSIYGAKFTNVTFIGDFKYIDIIKVNFTGSKNAVIDLSTSSRNLHQNIFCDVKFIGELKGSIYESDFTGSIGAKIDPQKIDNKYLANCKFKDVEFIGSFDDATIKCSDFSGSKGAVINPQKIYDRNMSYIKLKDTIINGSLDEVNIIGTDFTGSKGAVINVRAVSHFDLEDTILKDVTIEGVAEFPNFADKQIDGVVFKENDYINNFELDIHDKIAKLNKKAR